MVLFSKMLSCLVFLENSVRHSWNFLVELLGHLRLEKTIYKQVGEKLEGAMGINPILSKDEIFGHLNDTCQELLKQIGLEFNEFGEVVVSHVDIEKYISMLLTQPRTQSVINTPNN